MVVKVFEATAISVVAGSHCFTAAASAAPSMLETTWTSTRACFAGQGIDGERRTERGAADADVDQAFDLTQQALVDRLDQRAHPFVEHGGLACCGGIAHAAFGHMGSGATFGVVDGLACKQGGAARGETDGGGDLAEHGLHFRGEVRLRPIEADRAAGQIEHRHVTA